MESGLGDAAGIVDGRCCRSRVRLGLCRDWVLPSFVCFCESVADRVLKFKQAPQHRDGGRGSLDDGSTSPIVGMVLAFQCELECFFDVLISN